MWRVKSCPKCKGDVYAEQDSSGWNEICLQCGHEQALQTVFVVNGSHKDVGNLPYLPELEKVTSPSRL